SPRAGSGAVIGRGVPPVAGTATIGAPNSFVNRIVPSRLQAPENAPPLSQIVWTGPPSTPMRFSLPSEKKAISRLSGDQKKPLAPSVPDSRRKSRLSSDRTPTEFLPPSSTSRNATRRASGESAINGRKLWPDGGGTVKRVSSSGGGERRER